jgi:hypothetical protein
MSRLGRPADVVETDYLSTTALFTGHETNWTAFQVSLGDICYEPSVLAALASDDASYLFVGDINKPGVLDSPCLYGEASASPWAIELLHAARDNATVFELVGPWTANPDLVDDDAPVVPWAGVTGATSWLEWDWPSPRSITQASVADAALSSGPTYSTALQLRSTSGRWVTLARAAGPLGDAKGDAPFLLASIPAGMTATAMRVVATGPGAGSVVEVTDAHALGPAGSR